MNSAEDNMESSSTPSTSGPGTNEQTQTSDIISTPTKKLLDSSKQISTDAAITGSGEIWPENTPSQDDNHVKDMVLRKPPPYRADPSVFNLEQITALDYARVHIGDMHFYNYSTMPSSEQNDRGSDANESGRTNRDAAEAGIPIESDTATMGNTGTPATSRKLLDELVLDESGIGELLSESTPTYVSVGFNLIHFVSMELNGIAEDIWDLVVLSSASGGIWAGSVREYVSARWPQSVETIKNIIIGLAGSETSVESSRETNEIAIKNETLAIGAFGDHKRGEEWAKYLAEVNQDSTWSWTLENGSGTLTVSLLFISTQNNDPLSHLSLTGHPDHQAEVIEALGWLQAVLQNGDGNPFPCKIRLVIQGINDRGSWCTFESRKHQEYSEATPGNCWVPLLPHTACAANFSSPFWRPSIEGLAGIELTFDLMSILCGLCYETEFEGGILLCGDNSFVYPVAQFQNCVQWHFRPCQPDDSPHQAIDGRHLKGKELDDLRAHTKHFLGLWKDPEITLGTNNSQVQNVRFSSAKTVETTQVRDSFTVGGSVKLPGVLTLTGSMSYKVARTRQTPTMKGPIVDQLHSKINAPVLLYSPSEKRAWLVSFVSVVLHIARCRAFVRAELGYDVPACERSADGGRAAWQCIKQHQNECVKKAAPNEILTESERDFKISDHLEEIMNCVSLLRRETSSARGFFRDQVLGFELAALTMYKDSAMLKKGELESFASGWRPLLDSVEAVFFYEGIPDPIVPSPASELTWARSGPCGAAMLRRIPKNFNLLAASLPCLLYMAQEQGLNDDGTMRRLTPAHGWDCPTGDSLYPSCDTETSSHSCHCDRLQKVVPGWKHQRVPYIQVDAANTGAVLFTPSSHITMADLRDSAANEGSVAQSDLTPMQSDSGYESGQLELQSLSLASSTGNVNRDPSLGGSNLGHDQGNRISAGLTQSMQPRKSEKKDGTLWKFFKGASRFSSSSGSSSRLNVS